MQLTLVEHDSISKFPLPDKCEGRYWVTRGSADHARANLISVEGIEDRWYLKSNRYAWLADETGQRVKEAELEPNIFYDIRVGPTDESLLLLSEPSTADRATFVKYELPTAGSITLGRSDACEIHCASRFVSSRHAELTVSPEGVSLKDLGSANGTFVNGRRETECLLAPGDVVYITGIVIVAGSGFIAVNNPDGLVSVSSRLPAMSVETSQLPESQELEESSARVLFSRAPRLSRHDVAPAVIKVDSPPASGVGEEIPIMVTIGPAVTMGMASLFTGLFAVVNVMRSNGSIAQAAPTIVMSLSMLLGTITWPMLSRRYEKRNRTRREGERHEKYEAYIAELREQIQGEIAVQTETLRAGLPSVEDCAQRILSHGERLWNRTRDDDDFLRLRLGIGDWPLAADLRFEERRFSVEKDELRELMYELAEAPRVLKDVPVSITLTESPIVGIAGAHSDVVSLANDLVVQLASLHSYDELKMVFLYNECDEPLWGHVRWLPHCWSDDETIRYVATNLSELKQLSARLEAEISERQSASADCSPFYVIFAADRELASKAEFVARALGSRQAIGFGVIALAEQVRDLPKECLAVVEIEGAGSTLRTRRGAGVDAVPFTPDRDSAKDPHAFARVLANTRLDTVDAAFALPALVTFLDLYGVGKVEHLNVLNRWRENNPTKSLEAPIGVDSSGDIFRLDVHERYHGPHGLIAGMTGSGKSELIMSLILSLAVNFHPDEVAFVLIDYKGGGMASAFTHLPHVAGTITNLDGAAVQRSLISIQSELRRRQALFKQAAEATGDSNLDIYKYQQRFREGRVTEPLPHLLIIADEFAELKTQQPEFMTQLVSAARIGRSLGVHLILATQKPSGVVDDQIWSNSRFRICLKVQESADSSEVIKRPDAAALTVTGRYYVQVGSDEVFRLGQSAWAGAPYYPADRPGVGFDYSVTWLDRPGQQVRQSKIDLAALAKNPPKQVDAVAGYLSRLADEENARTRSLWLDQMPGLMPK
jgi:S-DNA-T family DNA segregation ATPase FtsK/SpoIIIE